MHKLDSANELPDAFSCQLEDLGIIKISGEEAHKYLQGQVTIDVDKLTESDFMLGCHCDFKGKTWNVFYAFGRAEEIYLLCHRQSIPASMAELKKYAVFSKADIADDSENWCIWGGKGNTFESTCQNLVATLPTPENNLSASDSAFVAHLAQPMERYLLIASKEHRENIQSSLTETTFAPDLWDLLDIKSGLANIQEATSNEFVPQMLNMQSLEAIDFQKGCYMGQEVVARTKYLGKNKRATFILHSDQAAELKAGDQLEMQLGENWRRGGVIIRSAMLSQQTWVLAVLPNDTVQGAVLRSKESPDLMLSVDSLPYTLE